MLLTKVLRQMVAKEKPAETNAVTRPAGTGAPRVLNVGGDNKAIPIPDHYAGWDHLLLDIDATGNPDVVCDARELDTLAAGQFDAVYCSHNLEHYYKHEGLRVLHGFLHVLKPDGFADIRVPDIHGLMKRVLASDLDLEDTLFTAPGGPVTPRDVIYGWSIEIEKSGNDFYAHKTGFTAKSLADILARAGFPRVFVAVVDEMCELRALAFKREPTPEQQKLLGLTA